MAAFFMFLNAVVSVQWSVVSKIQTGFTDH